MQIPIPDGKYLAVNLLMSRPSKSIFITIASLINKGNVCISLVMVTNMCLWGWKQNPREIEVSHRWGRTKAPGLPHSCPKNAHSSLSCFLRRVRGGCEVTGGKAVYSSAAPDAGEGGVERALGASRGRVARRGQASRPGAAEGTRGAARRAPARTRLPPPPERSIPAQECKLGGGRRGAPSPPPRARPRDASRGDWSGGGERWQSGAALSAHGRSSYSSSSSWEPCLYLLLRPARRRHRVPAASELREGGGHAAGPPPLEGSPAAARSLGRRLRSPIPRGLCFLLPPPPAPAYRRDGAPGLGVGQCPEHGVHGT